MGSLKPWQLILVILAVVVLGVSLWFSIFGGTRLESPNSVMLADIETGDRFIVNTSGSKIAILPAKNPESGVRSLFPVVRSDDGQWMVTPAMGWGLIDYEGPANAVSDRESRIVNISDRSPKKLD